MIRIAITAMISHTLSAWATALGVEPRTLERQLSRAGINLTKGQKLTAKQIDTARVGEKDLADIREKTARAEKLERENKVEDGKVIPLEENLAWQQRVLLPVRQRLLALSGTMAHRCNPTDPTHAQTQLDEWTKETLPLLREEIGRVGK